MESQTGLARSKGWGLFIVAIFLAVLLVVVGAHLVLFDPKLITPVMYFLISICFFAGAALVFVTTASNGWPASAGLVVLSIYTLARGANIINHSWLAILAGLVCWLAAGILLYVTYPRKRI